MKNIAIILARSGSKGIKNKNIKLLNDKPLLAYSVEAAIKSKCFDVVMVSTDSKKYAEIAKQYGAEVPFLRSKKNSADKSSSWDAIKEVLKSYKDLNKEFDTFMLLQPTSPLRTSKDIQNAYQLFKEKKANSIVSVCKAENVPEKIYKLNKSMYLSPSLKHANNCVRRQDQTDFYRFNGAIYLAKTKYFIKNNDIYGNKCYAYLMNAKTSIDIDSSIDFKIAEILIKENNGKK